MGGKKLKFYLTCRSHKLSWTEGKGKKKKTEGKKKKKGKKKLLLPVPLLLIPPQTWQNG